MHPKFSFAIFVLTFVSIFAVAVFQMNDTALAGENGAEYILFIGASEASGYGGIRSFPSLVEDLARADGRPWSIVNMARAGASTRDGREQIRAGLARKLTFSAAFISLGLADAVYAHPPSEIKANLQAMIRDLQTHSPGIEIYLCRGEIFQHQAIPGLAPRGSEYHREYVNLYAEIADTAQMRRNPIVLVPFIFRETVGRQNLNQSDHIHPNQAGARLIAKMVYSQLLE